MNGRENQRAHGQPDRSASRELEQLRRRAETAEAQVGELNLRLVAALQQPPGVSRSVELEEQRGQPPPLDSRARPVFLEGVVTASFAELAAATEGFAQQRILGRGGFGPVFRGEWGGMEVAIKRLDPESLQVPGNA